MADHTATGMAQKAVAQDIAQLEGESLRLIVAVERALRQGVAQPEILEAIGRFINLLADTGSLLPLEGARLKRDFWRGEFERAKRAIGQRDPGFGAELADAVAAPAKPAACGWKDCGAKADTVVAGRDWCPEHAKKAREGVQR